MTNPLAASVNQPQECEDHFLIRAAYAIGVGLILLGSALPHSERWVMGGVALIAVSSLY
jgi:hypothetical protein